MGLSMLYRGGVWVFGLVKWVERGGGGRGFKNGGGNMWM